jgi:hypothetical protein
MVNEHFRPPDVLSADYVPTALGDMGAELSVMRQWWYRMKRYSQ